MFWTHRYFRAQEPLSLAEYPLKSFKAVTMVCSEAHVIACDINELNPHYDQSGVSTIVACKIVREMLIALHENIFHQKED